LREHFCFAIFDPAIGARDVSSRGGGVMKMHVARRLSEAIGSWLNFEFCCYRAGLLSEDSLKAAVGSVLSTFPTDVKGARVHANFPHESLNPIKRTGRKREVDFALVLIGTGVPKSGAQIAVETKWAGSSHCSAEKIFQDFIRLAAIKRMDPGTACVFVLAGNDKNVNAVLKGMPFKSSGKVNAGIRFSGADCRFALDSSNASHRECFSKIVCDLSAAGFAVPASFVTSRLRKYLPIKSTPQGRDALSA
jgi:hypothetical protein